MIVRNAAQSDAPAIAALMGQLGYPCGAETMLRRIERLAADPHRAVWVAEELGEAIGFLELAEGESLAGGPAIEIHGLVVRDDRRGGGVGRRLVAAATEEARRRGYDVLRVRTNLARTGSQPFYAALGFRRVKDQAVFDLAL